MTWISKGQKGGKKKADILKCKADFCKGANRKQGMITKDFSHPSGAETRQQHICVEDNNIIGVEFEKQDNNIILSLLELSGFDELIGFKSCVEEDCHDIDEANLWYGRRIGSKTMGFEEKTSPMTATMVGSKGVLSYILETSCVDVNQACGLDGLLHFILLLL